MKIKIVLAKCFGLSILWLERDVYIILPFIAMEIKFGEDK
jgi:hypothetical protein